MIPFYQSLSVKRDHAYLIVVTLSMLAAALTRRIRHVTVKTFTTAIFGFAAALCFCGIEILYSLISILVGAGIIKFCKHGSMPRLVFGFTFLYRIVFCLLSYFEEWRDENNLANGIQLVLTIKLISVAYEVGDFRTKQHGSNVHMNGHANGVDSASLKAKNHLTLPLIEEPSFLDIVCYMYCFMGIGTGPFFRFRTYYDMIHMPHHIAKSVPAFEKITSRFPLLAILMLVSAVGGKFFSTDEMKSLDFYENRSLMYRFFYVLPIGAIGMARYGVIWFLSEFGFTMAGLGVYPETKEPEPGRGPTLFSQQDQIWPKKENPKATRYSIEAIRNVYIVRGLMAETYAKTFRWWNCTVQWWLAHFVYASKLFSGKPVLMRWLAVATVSAVWHGFKAGYYFSFLGMTYVAFAEHLLISQIGERLNGRFRTLFNITHYLLFKAVGIGSFMTTFALSSYDDIMTYLASVYYGIYAVATISIIMSLLARFIFPSKPSSNSDTSKVD